MKNEYLISSSRSVYDHLALEEFLVRRVDFTQRNLLLVYINEPCIVLGKNQNILREIYYTDYLQDKLPVARRISGGGTVVHDWGNINFAFFEAHHLSLVNQYQTSTKRLVNAINALGIACYLDERHAIRLSNGKKISGSAQFSTSQSILSHCTLLFQSDLEAIRTALRPNAYSLSSKASLSVPASIDKLSSYTTLDINSFLVALLPLMGYEPMEDPPSFDDPYIDILRTKYRSLEYTYDTACQGRLTNRGIDIEIQAGKIVSIQGVDHPENYQGKRLRYQEIPAKDPLWQRIL